jgi:hypothetical protein
MQPLAKATEPAPLFYLSSFPCSRVRLTCVLLDITQSMGVLTPCPTLLSSTPPLTLRGRDDEINQEPLERFNVFSVDAWRDSHSSIRH